MSGAVDGRPLDLGRLAEAVGHLAAGVAAPHVRAQLEALAALLRAGESATDDDPQERRRVEQEIIQAMEAGDEPRVLRATRLRAAMDRADLPPVDWTAVSGG